MRKYILFLLVLLYVTNVGAKEKEGPILKDTLYTELKNDIVILSSTKETNSLKNLPAAVSIFSQKNLDALQITSLKDLSSYVPNYFAANYGSKMTAPIYIRGVGARSGTQTVSLYVDNIPYFNTTSFDTEFIDIQRVEVLRGTQGTLYGRNAMGGIMNVYTYSPMSYDGTTAKIGGGSYGLLTANASHYRRLNDKMGISVSAYYKRHDGYFRNQHDGLKIDAQDNVGTRIKYVWNMNPRLSMNYTVSFDYLDQGAFPYDNVSTGKINYNSESNYKRKLLTNGLSFKYKGDGYEINSITGYQYLNDVMNMDLDYTSKSYFQMNQLQRENSISQEFTIKSTNKSNFQWSNGIYGFYDYLHTDPPVYMMKDGIQEHIIDNMGFPPSIPISFLKDTINLDGEYKKPVYGVAVFHQSTYNNLFIDGLSATIGLRLDYERTKLDYNAYIEDVNMKMVLPIPGMPPHIFNGDTAIVGNTSKSFLELLPKFVLKYQANERSHVYLSASKGYKTGGHNVQMFADILQDALKTRLMNQRPGSGADKPNVPINDVISFNPEYSWNYEFGGQVSIIDDILTSDFALFYVDIQDVQLTQFFKTMGGRRVVNGGKAHSKGFELSLKARPCTGFYLYANYGYANATLRDYITTEKVDGKFEEVDYSGNNIPFAPRSTFSVGGSVTANVKNNALINKVTFDSNFTGVGKMYWDESNKSSQGFYGMLNARIEIEKDIFAIELWGKNILDRTYRSFVFESSGNYYGQRGLPSTFGASLKIKL